MAQAIKLIDRDGEWYDASVEVELFRHFRPPEAPLTFDERLCRVTLRWAGGEVVGNGWDHFTAFCQVREQLEASGVRPHCYGASRKVILRGIEQDCVAGRVVWKAELGQPLSRGNNVDIFASGPDVEPVTVKEQRVFQEQWYGPSWPTMRKLLGY